MYLTVLYCDFMLYLHPYSLSSDNSWAFFLSFSQFIVIFFFFFSPWTFSLYHPYIFYFYFTLFCNHSYFTPLPSILSPSNSSVFRCLFPSLTFYDCGFSLILVDDLSLSLNLSSYIPLSTLFSSPFIQLLFFHFTFSYSLSAIPHFNLGKIHSSWKAEQQNINSSQTI